MPSKLWQRIGYGITYLHIDHHYIFINMLFRYCCPLKSLNVLRIIANKQSNKQTNFCVDVKLWRLLGKPTVRQTLSCKSQTREFYPFLKTSLNIFKWDIFTLMQHCLHKQEKPYHSLTYSCRILQGAEPSAIAGR